MPMTSISSTQAVSQPTIRSLTNSPISILSMRPSQRLARSAIDATRFTQTSPHAYSKSSAIFQSTASHTGAPSSSFQSNVPLRPLNQRSSQPSSPSSPQRPSETPAQKVARLRAEHIRNRQPKLTLWEKTVVRGRVIADKAHFVTAVFLIGLTGIRLPFLDLIVKAARFQLPHPFFLLP